mmetsp:Transcript_102415/g.330361  ORF Transcript_102415/g.330361 Transcript_102415/m.330361 type:complete len:244 (+) Transcript_102415:132-863(+)
MLELQGRAPRLRVLAALEAELARFLGLLPRALQEPRLRAPLESGLEVLSRRQVHADFRQLGCLRLWGRLLGLCEEQGLAQGLAQGEVHGPPPLLLRHGGREEVAVEPRQGHRNAGRHRVDGLDDAQEVRPGGALGGGGRGASDGADPRCQALGRLIHDEAVQLARVPEQEGVDRVRRSDVVHFLHELHAELLLQGPATLQRALDVRDPDVEVPGPGRRGGVGRGEQPDLGGAGRARPASRRDT